MLLMLGMSVTVKAMQKAMKAESQTALMGTSCLFTLCHTGENGMAPSLENAYAILTESARVSTDCLHSEFRISRHKASHQP